MYIYTYIHDLGRKHVGQAPKLSTDADIILSILLPATTQESQEEPDHRFFGWFSKFSTNDQNSGGIVVDLHCYFLIVYFFASLIGIHATHPFFPGVCKISNVMITGLF